MSKKELLQAKMNKLAEIFGAKSGEKVGYRCTGKWSGTTDYSVMFSNGEEFFISNGMTKFEEHLDEAINVYGNFSAIKSDILNVLHEMESADNAVAVEKGLKSYHVIDVDFNKSGDRLGWFYITMDIDGESQTLRETGLNCAIHNACRDNNVDGIKNCWKSWDGSDRKYFVAGGVNADEVYFVFTNVGFGKNSYSN